jgi:hypothetical protein
VQQQMASTPATARASDAGSRQSPSAGWRGRGRAGGQGACFGRAAAPDSGAALLAEARWPAGPGVGLQCSEGSAWRLQAPARRAPPAHLEARVVAEELPRAPRAPGERAHLEAALAGAQRGAAGAGRRQGSAGAGSGWRDAPASPPLHSRCYALPPPRRPLMGTRTGIHPACPRPPPPPPSHAAPRAACPSRSARRPPSRPPPAPLRPAPRCGEAAHNRHERPAPRTVGPTACALCWRALRAPRCRTTIDARTATLRRPLLPHGLTATTRPAAARGAGIAARC